MPPSQGETDGLLKLLSSYNHVASAGLLVFLAAAWPLVSLGEPPKANVKTKADSLIQRTHLEWRANPDKPGELVQTPIVLQRIAPSPDVIILLREGRVKGVTELPRTAKPLTPQKAQPVTPPGATKSERSKSVKSLKDGIWNRVRQRLVLVDNEHPRIEERIAYLRKNPGYLNLLAKRSEPFLHFIVEEIERRRLPADLALLPMVESAFEPTAMSPKGAAGLWQIMPATGEQYGLRITDGYDGRYDVYTSTRAALTYLSYLHKLFKGDWLLALAAYNVGEGAVQKALQASREAGLEANFWNLNLPDETEAYVPQIAALSRIVFDPNENGIKLKKVSNTPYLARIKVNADAGFLNNLTAAGISLDEFRRFNPAFKADVEIPAQTYNLMLPLDKAELLVKSIANAELIAARKHTVKKGETLSIIADQYGVSYLKLAQWNELSVKSVLLPGQELVIYPESQT